MRRNFFRLGLAAIVVAALTLLSTGTAQAAPWSHGHHGHHGHHGGFHPGHHGHHGGFHHPPMVIVRPPRPRPPWPRPPVYIYPRPPYHRPYVSPGAEIAGGVLRIIDGASRW